MAMILYMSLAVQIILPIENRIVLSKFKLIPLMMKNKTSYIDVDFKKSPGKFLLKFQFTEQKAGCVAFNLGIFKGYDYSSQQKD